MTFKVCMKTVNEFYVSNIAKWLNVRFRKASGCSYLNFKYRACFEQGSPWHLDNYRMCILSKARMWHNKNTQLKDFLPLYSVYQIFSFTAGLTHLRFSMVKQLQSRLARNWSKRFLFISKRFLSFSRYLFGS